MKLRILFFCTACLCFSLPSLAEGQRRRQGAASGSVRQHAVKEYKADKTYSLGDVVNLNADGNKLTVQLLKSKVRDTR